MGNSAGLRRSGWKLAEVISRVKVPSVKSAYCARLVASDAAHQRVYCYPFVHHHLLGYPTSAFGKCEGPLAYFHVRTSPWQHLRSNLTVWVNVPKCRLKSRRFCSRERSALLAIYVNSRRAEHVYREGTGKIRKSGAADVQVRLCIKSSLEGDGQQ